MFTMIIKHNNVCYNEDDAGKGISVVMVKVNGAVLFAY